MSIDRNTQNCSFTESELVSITEQMCSSGKNIFLLPTADAKHKKLFAMILAAPESILAALIQCASHPQVSNAKFKEMINAATRWGDEHRKQERETWAELRTTPKQFAERLILAVGNNDLLDLMDAMLTSQEADEHLFGKTLLHRVVEKHIASGHAQKNDYAIVRFLTQNYKLDIGKYSTTDGTTACAIAFKHADQELMRILRNHDCSPNEKEWSSADCMLPSYCSAMVEIAVKATRATLEGGVPVVTHVLVGNSKTGVVHPVFYSPRDDADKNAAAHAIQLIAAMENADFIVQVSESWQLRADKLNQVDEIYRRYGSIGASPFAIDSCSFIVETREGTWAALPEIKRKGKSNKKRTFGEAKFIRSDASGRFANLLPPVKIDA